VRIRSIFRKGEVNQSEIGNRKSKIALLDPAELALAKKLCQFGETLPTILEDHRPNLLANYLYELAATFHSFFEACPVLKSEGVMRHTRLVLCEVTARVLAQGLALLGIGVPERM
jgi:arginyl-tRNA synthetase